MDFGAVLLSQQHYIGSPIRIQAVPLNHFLRASVTKIPGATFPMIRTITCELDCDWPWRLDDFRSVRTLLVSDV